MGDEGAPEPAELAEHPGRPRGRDEIDPELVRLPRPRARIGWLLALSVIVFCGYFMLRLRDDLAFSRQGDDPERLADAAALITAAPDSHVEVVAPVDRAFLLRVFASEATDGHRLAPVLGAGDRAWIMLPGSHWQVEPRYDEVVRGRVRRLGDLPFHGDLQEQLATMTVPRGVAVPALRGAIEAGARSLEDVAGESLAVAPDTAVILVQRVSGRAVVTAFRGEKLVDEAGWRAALEAAGVLAPGTPLAGGGAPDGGGDGGGGGGEGATRDSWSFEVDAPDGVDALGARLVEAQLWNASAAPLDRVHRTRMGALAGAGDAVTIQGEGGAGAAVQVPWSEITSAALEVPRQAPADARVLVATERPEDYWYVLPLFALFGGFVLLFAWALVRTVRADRAEAADAAAEAATTAAAAAGTGAASAAGGGDKERS